MLNDPERGRVPLADHAARWLADRPDVHPRRREIYRSLLRLNVVPRLGVVELAGITPATVRSWRAGGRREVPCGHRSAETRSCSSTERGVGMAREDSVPISRTDSVAHCRQAEEYLRAAEHSLEIGDFNADAGTAIDAADAMAGTILGRRWEGPHDQAVQFVARAGSDGQHARQGATPTDLPQDAVALQLEASDARQDDVVR